MKKVGIITFHKSLNYGSALQAWALSNYISKLGYDVKIVDYTPNNYREYYDLFWKPTSVRYIKSDLLHTIWLPFLLRRKKGFSDFSDRYLPLSEKKYASGDDLTDFVSDQDIMICGSDQIWNTKAIDFNLDYVLYNYHCKRKVSYAPSIGDSILDESKDAELIKNSLKEFDFLSAREQSGASNIEAFLGHRVNVETVLDPTLLHNASDYKKLAFKKRMKKPYIFFYSVWYASTAVEAAIALSQKYDLPVYTMMSGRGNSYLLKNMSTIKLPRYDCGPSGFLSMIKNAKYVITDSFHGTAFSVIFEKKFVAINNAKSDGTLQNDERIRNLLGLLGLTSHYIPCNEVRDFDLNQNVDYSVVNKKRLDAVEKSKAYIKRALEI